MTPEQHITQNLIDLGRERFDVPRHTFDFETGIPEAERMLNDIENYPYHFVLGCVMDRQMRTGRAWAIPYRVGEAIYSFTFKDLINLDKDEFVEIFVSRSLHRFNTLMASNFYAALQLIASKYDGNAANIWSGTPKSATIIRRFLEFRGVGVKIANMATNILARDFKVPMAEYSSIDIAPDAQVKKFFIHHHLLRPEASNEELIYLARELYPEYPGILDIAAWELGRKLKNRPLEQPL